MKKFDIAIIGGDKRTACMEPIFAEKGYHVVTCGTAKIPGETADFFCGPDASFQKTAFSFQETVEAAEVLVCGIPFQQKNNLYFQEGFPPVALTELQRCLRKHQKVFGGVIPENFRRHCDEREIGCYDFMRDEALTLFNAIATAEGAILEALLHKETNLHHSHCLVLGYGRCGRVLAQKLLGLNARVTVCSADLKELALADSMGMDTLPLPRLKKGRCRCGALPAGDERCRSCPSGLSDFEYIFNTIPAVILKEDCLKLLTPASLIIDIASNQGGVDYDAAERLGIPARHCLGLPGKYAGYSSAKRLSEYVIAKIS